MTVGELRDLMSLTEISVTDPDREIGGVYCGDLLSWVMGRAKCDDLWITIMSNINVVAVASLADVSCVILAEGTTLEQDVIETARSKGVNILCSQLPIYETAVAVSRLLSDE